MEQKFPLPPFTLEDAKEKIKKAENAWNGKNSKQIAMAYSEDSVWRNRDLFINGRNEIIEFLDAKWKKEQDYKLKKEYWAHTDNKIAVRFEYEYKDDKGNWFRAYGNENWAFDANGLMKERYASINDLAITEAERKLR